jgi:hypothetical protein
MEQSEKKQNEERKRQDIEHLKKVEFYSQSYASFFSTTIEKDKSILAVSAGGIGLLITLINFSKKIEVFEYLFFLFAAISFILAILTIIYIFRENAEYIIALTTESTDLYKKGCKLKMLDNIATCAFLLGIALSLVPGVTLSYQNIKKEVEIMTEKKDTSQNTKQFNDSFSGAANLKKSFSGAAQMRPEDNTQSAGNNNSDQSDNNNSIQPDDTTSANNTSTNSEGD